jgi:hypothetical protein
MNEQDLARAVAADLGADVLAAIDAPPHEDAARAFGIPETMAIGGFLVSCAQFAFTVWHAQRNGPQLIVELLGNENLMQSFPSLATEKRLGVIARIATKLTPETFDQRPEHSRAPDLAIASTADKQQWIIDYLKSRGATGDTTRDFATRDFQGGATILVPFAEQHWWILYQNIGWVPDETDGPGVMRVDVPKGFVTDLASVPSYLWAFLQKTGRHGNAAIYHDWLYWQQADAGVTREMADRVFDRTMHDMGVDGVTRNLIWAGVRVFGGSYWDTNTAEKTAGAKRVLQTFPDNPTITWEDWRQRPDVFI